MSVGIPELATKKMFYIVKIKVKLDDVIQFYFERYSQVPFGDRAAAHNFDFLLLVAENVLGRLLLLPDVELVRFVVVLHLVLVHFEFDRDRLLRLDDFGGAARVRDLPVRLLVPLHVRAHAERLLADRTIVRFLAGVDFPMVLQVGRGSEGFAAILALVVALA